jgi:hypothetical protein
VKRGGGRVDLKRSEITELAQAIGWIALKELMPPKGEWVLFWYPWGAEVNKLKWVGEEGQLDFHRYYYGENDDPSHWMLLPEPPEEAEDDQQQS